MSNVPPTSLEGESGEKAAKASVENLPAKSNDSVSPEKAAPAPARHVIGKGDTDEVRFSSYVSPATSKNLTIHHVQRALVAAGHGEAGADRDGRVGELTELAIRNWQKAQKAEQTGKLTPKQFEALFKGDPNVSVVLDTPDEG